jgi:phage shock protein A
MITRHKKLNINIRMAFKQPIRVNQRYKKMKAILDTDKFDEIQTKIEEGTVQEQDYEELIELTESYCDEELEEDWEEFACEEE